VGLDGVVRLAAVWDGERWHAIFAATTARATAPQGVTAGTVNTVGKTASRRRRRPVLRLG
jgi:hypothetical protein